jgi:hypothetical protein
MEDDYPKGRRHIMTGHGLHGARFRRGLTDLSNRHHPKRFTCVPGHQIRTASVQHELAASDLREQ